MRPIFLKQWYKRLPRAVLRTVEATIFRAPAEKVKTKNGHYFDSMRIRVAGIVKKNRYIIFGATDHAGAVNTARGRLDVALERQEIIRAPKRLRRDVDVFKGDVVLYRETVE